MLRGAVLALLVLQKQSSPSSPLVDAESRFGNAAHRLSLSSPLARGARFQDRRYLDRGWCQDPAELVPSRNDAARECAH